MLAEKNKMANFQKENEKLKSKLADRDNYISKLPTEEEVMDINKKVHFFIFILCKWIKIDLLY
jgi:hypothetical protein